MSSTSTWKRRREYTDEKRRQDDTAETYESRYVIRTITAATVRHEPRYGHVVTSAIVVVQRHARYRRRIIISLSLFHFHYYYHMPLLSLLSLVGRTTFAGQA
jgi:hypothetical protein